MTRINTYIFRQLVFATLFVAIILTVIVSLIRSLRLIDFVVNRGLPSTVLLQFTALLLPTFLVIVLPIALFTAVLFVYNKLLSDSELVIMRSAGLSQLALATPALLIATIVTIASYGLHLYWLPASYGQFKDLRFSYRNSLSSVLLHPGRFSTPVDGLTVYVRAREDNGDLLGIFVHDTRVPGQPVTLMAERGALVSNDAGTQVVMFNGNRQEVDTKDGQLVLLYFDQNSIDLRTLDETAQPRWRDPQERFIGELLRPSGANEHTNRFIAEGHRRLSNPLNILAFTIIAIAALLAGQFDRRGQARRIMVAVLAAVTVQGGGLGIANLAASNLAVVPAMYVLPVAAIGVGLTLLLRPPRRRAVPA